MSNIGDGEMEIEAQLAKACQAFTSSRSTWKARNIHLKTKLRIFKSNVLYGSVMEDMTNTICN
jgi:hypothetical protein